RISGAWVATANTTVDRILDCLKPIDVIADGISNRGNFLAGQFSLENLLRDLLQILDGYFVNDLFICGFHRANWTLLTKDKLAMPADRIDVRIDSPPARQPNFRLLFRERANQLMITYSPEIRWKKGNLG